MCQHVCWVAYTDSRVVVGALLTLPACLVLQVSALQGEQRSLMTALEAVEAALHDARQVRCIWGACVSACRVAAFFGGRNGSAGVRHQPQVCVCAFRGPAQASPVLVEEGLSHATAARIDRDRTTPCYVHLCAQVCGEQSTLRQRYEGALESKTQTISHLRRELKEARKAAGQVRNRAARQWDSRAGARTVCCSRHPAAGKLEAPCCQNLLPVANPCVSVSSCLGGVDTRDCLGCACRLLGRRSPCRSSCQHSRLEPLRQPGSFRQPGRQCGTPTTRSSGSSSVQPPPQQLCRSWSPSCCVFSSEL